MGEPASKRQPLIDLYDFERRMRSGAPVEPAAPIGGDFAEIEAALLRAANGFDPVAALDADAARTDVDAARPVDADAPRLDLRATREADDEPAGFAAAPFAALAPDREETFDEGFSPLRAHSLGVDAFDEPFLRQAAADHFVYVDDAAVAGEAGLYEEKRSRLPLYIMAAVAIAGAAGLLASTALKREAPDASALMASVSSDAAPAETAAAPQAVAPVAEAPSQQAEAPAPAPRETLAEAPAAVTPPAPAAAPVAAASLLAPPPYGASGAPAALAHAAPEPKLVKTAAVRPDGALVKPAHAATAEIKPEAAKPAAVKPAKTAALPPPRPAQTATAEKPAAEKPAKTAAKPRDAAKAEAKAKPAHAPAAVEPAPVEQAAAAPVEIAPVPPKPAPLAFVDTAVSSITGATSKIFDWGKTAATNLAHN